MWSVLEALVVMAGLVSVAGIICFTHRRHYSADQNKPLELARMKHNQETEKAMLVESVMKLQLDALREGHVLEVPKLPASREY